MRQYDSTYHERYVALTTQLFLVNDMVMGHNNYDKNKNFRWMLASFWAPGDVVEFLTTAAYTSLGQSGVTYNNNNQLVVQNKKSSPSIYADGQNMYYNCWW
jgi:hypothetical protein